MLFPCLVIALLRAVECSAYTANHEALYTRAGLADLPQPFRKRQLQLPPYARHESQALMPFMYSPFMI